MPDKSTFTQECNIGDMITRSEGNGIWYLWTLLEKNVGEDEIRKSGKFYFENQELPDEAYQTSVNAIQYRGNNGKIYEIPIKGTTGGSVYGTDIYTDDSNIASAAVHAGKVKVGEKRIVKIKILGSQSSFTSSTRNGITSISYGSWSGSYQFVD